MRILKRKRTDETQLGRRRPNGSAIPPAGTNRTFSYYASRSSNDLNVGRSVSAVDARIQGGRNSRLRVILRNIPVIVASLAIVACVLDQLILSSSPRVEVLSSTAGNVFLQSKDVYQKTAAALFRGSLANHNKLTVNVNSIRAAMKRKFPELNDVSIALPIIGHRPVVYIQPYEPVLALTTAGGNDMFLLNASGEALMRVHNKSLPTNLHTISVVDQSGLQISVGQPALPSTTVQFIQTVVSQLTAQHMTVSKAVLPTAGSELDIYLKDAHYFGKFNLQQTDALQQVGTFIAVVKHLATQGKEPGQYIDVRLDGRAYYK